jgi:DNA (cytosine-5)-methyltransferase 1
MKNMKNPSPFTFIDLFAGIGGFHSALSSMGGECVMACEIDEMAQQVYKNTYPTTPIVSNIRELTRDDINNEQSSKPIKEIAKLIPDHLILCGGFPCQAFSKSGKQKGFDDKTRGTLFFDILEIIKAKHPKYVLLENVKNLTGPKHKDTWDTIIMSLRNEGYTVSSKPTILSPHLLPADKGGAPQVRERVFIAATLKSNDEPLFIEKESFKDTHSIDSWDIADYLLADNKIPNVSSYQLSPDEGAWVEAWDYFVKHIDSDSLPGFPIWADSFTQIPAIEDHMPDWKKGFLQKNSDFYNLHTNFINDWKTKTWGINKIKFTDFPPSRRKLEWQARKQFPTKKNRTLEKLTFQMRPSGIRVKPATYLPALVAITQTSIIGPGVKSGINQYRKLTPTEAAKLQGIDGTIFSKAGVTEKDAYKQLGNGVNVGVVRYVAELLMK